MNVTTHYFSTNTSCHSSASFNTNICNALLKDCHLFRVQTIFNYLDVQGEEDSRSLRLYGQPAKVLQTLQFNCEQGEIRNNDCRQVVVSLTIPFNGSIDQYLFDYRVNTICKEEKECQTRASSTVVCKATEGCCQRVLDMANKAHHCTSCFSLNKLFFGLGAVAYWSTLN